jgi:hypothetical protein
VFYAKGISSVSAYVESNIEWRLSTEPFKDGVKILFYAMLPRLAQEHFFFCSPASLVSPSGEDGYRALMELH